MSWIALLNSLLGVAVMIRAVCILDHMGRTTSHWTRCAAVLLATSGLAAAARPLYLIDAPEWPTLMMHAAIALWLWSDRRQPGGGRAVTGWLQRLTGG